MDPTQKIADMIAPTLESMGYELVRVTFTGGEHQILQIMAEKEDGTMTIEGCEEVSRAVSVLLDVEDPIKGQYELEVSSPGLDRPIFTIEQFRKYIGETIKLRLYEKINERKRFTGVLISVENDVILINCENEDFEVPVNMVDKAQLVPQF